MRNWKLQVYGHLKCMKATRFPHATRSAAVRSCNGKCSSRVLASSALLKRKWIVMVLAWWVCDGVWVFRIETSTLCDNARFPGALEVECYLKNIFTITLINHLKTIVFVVYMSIYIIYFFSTLFFVSTFTASNEYHWSEANSIITACQHMYNTSVFPSLSSTMLSPSYFFPLPWPWIRLLRRRWVLQVSRAVASAVRCWEIHRNCVARWFDGWGWGWGWWCSITSLICS